MFLFLIICSLICIGSSFKVENINGSIAEQMVFIITFKDNFMNVYGSGISEKYRVSLQDDQCGKNVPLDKYHEPFYFENVTNDGSYGRLNLPFNHSTYLGIFKLCVSFQLQGSDFSYDTKIYIGIRSLYQLCHRFGATARAIRDCIKTIGDKLEPRQEVELIPSNFQDPIFSNLYEYEHSEKFQSVLQRQEEINKQYKYSPDSINQWDYGMNLLPGGVFMMGSDVLNARTDPVSGMSSPGEGEYPIRPATIKPFFMDRTDVTNGQFREFVRKTGYKTDTEYFGWSFVFETMLDREVARESEYIVKGNPWWHQIVGSYWRLPYGPKSKVPYHLDHPVVHVSYRDAQNYCHWRNKRLPTEAEWEWASRGGLDQHIFPWGNEPPNQFAWKGQRDKPLPERCNLFQGEFPYNNTVDDGWYGTSPALSFPPNNFGLYNMVGNVWNWVEDEYQVNHTTDEYKVVNKFSKNLLNYDKMRTNIVKRVSKGGSFICFYLCARNSARQGIDSDSSASNLGFRCAKDVDKDTVLPDYEIHYGQYITKDALKAGTSVIRSTDTEHSHEKKYPKPPDIYYP